MFGKFANLHYQCSSGKLNYLRAQWPMDDPALIPGFCSVKRRSVFLKTNKNKKKQPLDGTLIHRRLASSRRCYSFTMPGRLESRVCLSGKGGCTNIQISAKPGIELGILWSEGRDLTYCSNHVRPRLWYIWKNTLVNKLLQFSAFVPQKFQISYW